MPYLSTVKDASTNEILAYHVSDRITLDIATKTIHKLMNNKKITLHKEAFIHSDQGSHYTSPRYQKLLKEFGLGQSMSRRGNCWDNAHKEPFFGRFKDEVDYKSAKTKEEIKLISKLNPLITQGRRAKEDEFEFNKDVGMYVCKAGHMAIRKARIGKKNQSNNQQQVYYFDIEKCKVYPFHEVCYKEGAKCKTYSVSIKSTEHKEQEIFQNSEEFKELARSRYKIEAKNSELKHGHGYDTASSAGLFGMEIQGATTIFAVNLKRIITLLKEM